MHLFNDDIRNSLSSEFPDESQSFDLLMDAVTSNSAIKATSKYSTAPAGNGRTNQQMNSAMPTGNAKGDKLDLTEAKSGTTSKPKRRRECLNHLTFEEKMMRRKLKNRLSAQSARDRKKDKMVNLQDHLETLDKEKMEALRQNEILRLQNEYLEKENVKLRRQLESYQTTTTDNSKSFPTEAKESEKADNSKAGEPIPNFFQSPVSSFVNNNSSSSFRCSTLVPSTCLAENANTSSILPSVSNKGTVSVSHQRAFPFFRFILFFFFLLFLMLCVVPTF